MTPSHAVKDGKRYRYYLSNNLIAGRDAKLGEGLRIPAHEVEGHVVTAICRLLTDAQQLTNLICTRNEEPAVMGGIVRRAQALSRELASDTSTDRYQAIRDLVSSVRVMEKGIRLVLNRKSLERQLEIAIHEERTEAVDAERKSPIVLDIPAELRRLGKEKRFIVAAHLPETDPDYSLIKAIVRAYQWFEMLRSRSVASIADVARSEELPRTYVSSLIPLALLAPDIIEAILRGRQPIDVTLDRILSLTPLPVDWTAQRAALGFASR